jgi:ArsR family transcriptional regulator, virulence genes transcriptional regulator
LAGQDMELFRKKAELCKTLCDATRLAIVDQLRRGEKSVGTMVDNLGLPQAVVSRHLGLLRERGVLIARRNGTSVYYRLADPKIAEACDLVHTILMNQMARTREMADRLVPPALGKKSV